MRPWFWFGRFSFPRFASFLGGLNDRNLSLLPRFTLLLLRSFAEGALPLFVGAALPLFGGVNGRNPSLFPRFALLFAGRLVAGEATRASFGDIAGG